MKVLFILGNGFDINLGLSTRYQDFYDYYLKQSSETELIDRLKQHLKKERYSTWADLELGLGAYTKNVDSIEDLELLIHNITDHLREYLSEVMDSFSFSANLVSRVFNGLSNPHKALPGGVARELDSFMDKNDPRRVDVISFNYTDVLERIVAFARPNESLPVIIGKDCSLASIRHIHMTLSNMDIILGVNDESQIANESLRNEDGKMLLVKPQINRLLETRVDNECKSLIKGADLICLFGVSLGETDSLWWHLIGDHIEKTSARLICFFYDQDDVKYCSDQIRKQRECRTLLNLRLWGKETGNSFQDQIYIGYKAGVFDG